MSAADQRVDWVVAAGEAGVRLDRFLAARRVLGTRSQVQRLIEAGRVLVDGRIAKGGTLVRAGQHDAISASRRTLRFKFFRSRKDLKAQSSPRRGENLVRLGSFCEGCSVCAAEPLDSLQNHGFAVRPHRPRRSVWVVRRGLAPLDHNHADL